MPDGFTLYQANCLGKKGNCLYPHEIHVTDAGSLKLACRRDYVCARYKDGYRSGINFMSSDCVALDLDNDHSDDPAEWIQPRDILKVFPNVTVGIHFSRHHMKEKDDSSARPRFHVLFRCSPVTDGNAYTALKQRIQRVYEYFDHNAMDAARFFFGSKDGTCEYHPGSMTIQECLDLYYPEVEEECASLAGLAFPERRIPEGSRNATLSRFAGRILKRLGPTDEAEQLFITQAAKCDPPLEGGELACIWGSAKRFYARISQQAGYVSPDQYGSTGRRYDPADRTDVGQAELLEQYAGARLRFSDKMGFMNYNAVYWEESEPIAQGTTQELTREQLQESRTEMEAAWERCKEKCVDADWHDEKNWYLCNPSLDYTITIDKVRDAYHKALETPADENMFRQLRLNQWVKQSVRWMQMDKWDACDGAVSPRLLEGRPCYAGMDLSSTSDLTAFVLVFPPTDENEPYIVLPFFWLPEETLSLRVRRDHVMYDQWERQGFLQTTEGNVVDYRFIEQFILQLNERYNIREIAYDRWNASMMVQTLQDDGFTMVPFGQGFRDMSAPTKELMRLVLEKKLHHGGHPVLRWNMDNAMVRTDPAGNLKIDKEKSTEKVDGAVAMVMALDRAMKNMGDNDSVYNHRGFLVL